MKKLYKYDNYDLATMTQTAPTNVPFEYVEEGTQSASYSLFNTLDEVLSVIEVFPRDTVDVRENLLNIVDGMGGFGVLTGPELADLAELDITPTNNKVYNVVGDSVLIQENYASGDAFPGEFEIPMNEGEILTYYNFTTSTDLGTYNPDVRLTPPAGKTLKVNGVDEGEFYLKGFASSGTGGSNVTIEVSEDGNTAHVRSYGTDFQGSDSSTAGSAGAVPTPIAGEQDKTLYGDGTWRSNVYLYNGNGNAVITAIADSVLRYYGSGGHTFTIGTTNVPEGRIVRIVNDGTGFISVNASSGDGKVATGQTGSFYFRAGGWRRYNQVEPVLIIKINSAGATQRVVLNSTGGTVTTSISGGITYINVTGGAFPSNAVGQVTPVGFNSGIGYIPHFYQDSTTQCRISVTKQESGVTTSSFARDISVIIW